MNALVPSSRSTTTLTSRRLHQWLLVFAFFGVLAAPLAGLFNPDAARELRERENREAAAFPVLERSSHSILPIPKKRSVQEFPRQFEAWLNDHLGFRRQRLGLYNLAQHTGLLSNSFARPAVGQADRAPVIIGRDGWLFFSGDRLVEDYRCTAPFTDAELAHWRKILLERHEWLAQRGKHYLVVFAPNKHSIYPEFLPRAMNRVGAQARLDQLIDYMADTPVQIVDLRQALIDAKDIARTYHRTDTHWNEFGAWAGYRELMSRLQTIWPGVRSYPLDAYRMETADSPGDYLAKLVESPFPYREDVIRLHPKSPRRAVSRELVVPDSDETRYHESTCANAELPGIVVVHDSFMNALAPFLNEHFQRIQYVSTNEFPLEVIEREDPPVVIHEYVQRRLMDHHPRNPPALSTH